MLTYVGAIFTYLIFECPLNSILLGPFKVQFCLRWGGGYHRPEVRMFSRIYENILLANLFKF